MNQIPWMYLVLGVIGVVVVYSMYADLQTVKKELRVAKTQVTQPVTTAAPKVTEVTREGTE